MYNDDDMWYKILYDPDGAKKRNTAPLSNIRVVNHDLILILLFRNKRLVGPR
jgi:hypothetical protein